MQTRTRFSKAFALLVVASALVLGGSARAMEEGEPAKHADEMAKGKNHEAAAEAAKLKKAGNIDLKKHADEMAKGKNHEAAAAATASKEPGKADLKKHADEMAKGKNHEAAAEAAKSK